MAWSLDELANSLTKIQNRLDEIEPNPNRSDWSSDRDLIEELDRTIGAEVLPATRELRELIEDEEERASVELNIAFLLSHVSVLFAVSKVRSPTSLMSEALQLSRRNPVIFAARSEPETYAAIVHGQWLLHAGKERAAQKIFAQVQKTATADALKECAKASADAPRPMSDPPSLFTLNSVGTGLYGRRDQYEDGTYIATLCICALFIPIFPLTAYRVMDHDEGGYLFFSKQRLSSFARIYRAGFLALGFLAITGFLTQTYLESPSRLASQNMEQARQEAKAGDPQRTAAAYEQVLHTYHMALSYPDAQEAGLALAKAYTAKLPRPMTEDAVTMAQTAMTRFAQLPVNARSGTALSYLVTEGERWVDEVGIGSRSKQNASLNLLGSLTQLVPVPDRKPLLEKQLELRMAMAKDAAKDWPLEALTLLDETDGNTGYLPLAEGLLKKMSTQPFLLQAAEEQTLNWITRAKDARLPQEDIAAVEASLSKATARMKDEARQKALTDLDKGKLRVELKSHPWDQVVAYELAVLDFREGKKDAAKKRLEAFGGPGWLIPAAQRLVAAIRMSQDELESAEAVLERVLAARAPAYRKANKAWSKRAQYIEKSSIDALQQGTASKAFIERLNAATDDEAREMVNVWLQDRIKGDRELQALDKKIESMPNVVPAALSLGMVRLRRANATTGEERTRLLASAEEAYLSVRSEASGMPSFHIGLGQVFHRLGKSAEGEREMQAVLANPDMGWHLSVAAVYRDLSLAERGIQVVENVYKNSEGDLRYAAASQRALMAISLAERQTWYERANPKDELVKNELLGLRAERAMREGRYDEADKMYAKTAAWNERRLGRNDGAPNNAALAYISRYECTGDRKHVLKATKLLERALRDEPNSAIVANNLSDAVGYRGHLEVLDEWIKPQKLALTTGDAEAIINVLASGGMRDEVKSALLSNSSMGRAKEVTQQAQALSPRSMKAFGSRLGWAVRQKSVKKLQALREHLNGVGDLDRTAYERQIATYRSGAKDAIIQEHINTDLEKYQQQVLRVEGDPDKRPLAALRYLQAITLVRQGNLTTNPDDLRLAVARIEESATLWPDAGFGMALPRLLLELSSLEAMKTSPELKKAWEAESRLYPTVLLVHRGLIGPSGSAVRVALAERPEVKRAVGLAKKAVNKDPTLTHWLLSRIVMDKQLEEKAAEIFVDPFQRGSAELTDRAYKTESTAARWALYQSHPKK